MTCCRLKVVFFVLLNSLLPALVVAVVSFGSGDHVCTTGNSGSGSCKEKDVEIYPRSDFSLDCGENSACLYSSIVVGSGSTFTGDFVCGADGRPSYMSCKNADITFYATNVSTYKVSCYESGEAYDSCRDTVFTLVDTSLEIYCDAGECQDMVIHVCGDSHVHVSGALDSGYPLVINRYGDDATAVVDETGAYSITNSAAEQCPVLHFACADGCEIVAGYVDDGVCDCSECEDEIAFDCDSCYNGCSAQCGQRNQCTNIFVCGDGCIISDDYVEDGWCDCPNCEDEPNWECGTGNCHCPTCGESSECLPTTTTLTPTTITSTPTTTTLTPTTTTLTPTTTTHMPTTTTLTPTTTTLMPTTTTHMHTTTTPMPTTTTHMPTTTTPMPTTTSFTPTTTLTPTKTTLKPKTTASKPTTTTPKPTTTTFKPTTTTVKPTSTATPSTTTLMPTTNTEEPSTTDSAIILDVESTVLQTSEQPTGVQTTKDSPGGNGDTSPRMHEIVLLSFGLCAVAMVGVFFAYRYFRATNEVTTAVNPPPLDLAVGTLTTAPMGVAVTVTDACHESVAPPPMEVTVTDACHESVAPPPMEVQFADTYDVSDSVSTEVAVTDACHASVAPPPMEVQFADTHDASDSVSTEVEGAGVAEHSNADAPRGTEWYVGDDGDYIDDDSEYERVLGDWAL